MKAIVLLSGGLDSSLALKMIVEQGIEVHALHFVTSFCNCDGTKSCGSTAGKIAKQVGVKLKVVHLGAAYFDIVKNPRFGYGKNMNPCMDCRILKFTTAKRIMDEQKASFLVTGEVIGQRPFSQQKQAMEIIERESGLEGLIVRPLSAKLMAPTIPEREGWVNREKFFQVHGRTRKLQLMLAREMDIKDYACPAGGCLLTEKLFCNRLKDLLRFGELDLNNAELLKLGRHFRVSESFKFIVGRNEQENNRLRVLRLRDDFFMNPGEVKGPDGLGRGIARENDLRYAAEILASYSSPSTTVMEVFLEHKGAQDVLRVEKKQRDRFRAKMI